MQDNKNQSLGIIAGRGVYPLLLARSARQQGIRNITAFAFKGETRRSMAAEANDIYWLHPGQLAGLLAAMRRSGIRRAVMVGQITPRNIFTLRPDRDLKRLLSSLPEKNAHTIFGAIVRQIEQAGIELLPAYRFMEQFMPGTGPLTANRPTKEQQLDIKLGLKVAKRTSGLEIGQTVAVKNGVILAVEAFEGTDRAIRRAGRVGGPGAVIVKVARCGHDMRFDIPVIGMRTVKNLRRARAAVLAVEARRTILLEYERVLAGAEADGISVIAIETTENNGKNV